MGEIMRLVREACTANNSEPIAMNDLLKKLQKKQQSMGVEKDELQEVLKYYKKLQVIHVNTDEEVFFV